MEVEIPTRTCPRWVGERAFFAHAVISATLSAPLWYFQSASADKWAIDRHLSFIVFGEGLKSMTSLQLFLTPRVVLEFSGSSDDSRIFNNQTANETRKKAESLSLKFDLPTIKTCICGYKSSRLVLRCWCLTSMNHEVVMETIVRYLLR